MDTDESTILSCIAYNLIALHSVASDVGDVSLEAELFVHEDLNRPKRKKKLKDPTAEEVVPECRIMAVCALPLSAVCDSKESTTLYYIATGCSDGVIRYVDCMYSV